MTDFSTWDRETLNKYAYEAMKEIEALKEDLRVALEAYRKLVVQNARETD